MLQSFDTLLLVSDGLNTLGGYVEKMELARSVIRDRTILIQLMTALPWSANTSRARLGLSPLSIGCHFSNHLITWDLSKCG